MEQGPPGYLPALALGPRSWWDTPPRGQWLGRAGAPPLQLWLPPGPAPGICRLSSKPWGWGPFRVPAAGDTREGGSVSLWPVPPVQHP